MSKTRILYCGRRAAEFHEDGSGIAGAIEACRVRILSGSYGSKLRRYDEPIFFRDLEMRNPDFNLEVASGSVALQKRWIGIASGYANLWVRL